MAQPAFTVDAPETPHDHGALRRALARYPTGVTIVTARTASGRRVGVTSNSFAALSLQPALVIWSLQKTSSSIAQFLESNIFIVNVLRADQVALSRHFAVSSDDKFEGVEHEVGLADCPAFAESLARFECCTKARIDAGDHVLFIGAVEAFAESEGDPLVYGPGGYCRTAPLHDAA